MKYLLLFVFSVCYFGTTQASEKQAFLIASDFVSKNFVYSSLKNSDRSYLKLVYTGGENQKTRSSSRASYYVYNVADNGFVVVSNEKVVGYNKENIFHVDSIPEALLWYLDQCATPVIQPVSESKETIRVSEIVSPLLKSRWGQAFPFSNETPIVDGRSTACGCVATAIAQIMYYWKWPNQGHGEKEYISRTHKISLKSDFSRPFRWDYMKSFYDREDKSGISYEEINEISYLLQQCGIISEMDYTNSGSGAYPSEAVLGMARYFDYKQTTLRTFSTSEMEEEKFISLLKKELDMKRPVLSAGGGHEFVCDGYDSADYFHFDWGEYGYDNGFFKINSSHSHIGPNELSVITGIMPMSVAGEAVAAVDFQSESLTLNSEPECIGDWIDISYSYTMNILGGDTLEYGIAQIDPSTNKILGIHCVEKLLPMVSYGSYVKRFKIVEPIEVPTLYTFTPVKKEKGDWTFIDIARQLSVLLAPKTLTPVDLNGFCAVSFGYGMMYENQSGLLQIDISNNGTTPYRGPVKIELIDSSGKVYDVIDDIIFDSQNDNQFVVPYVFRKPGNYICRVFVEVNGRMNQLNNLEVISITARNSVPIISSININTSLHIKDEDRYEEIKGNRFDGTLILCNNGPADMDGRFVFRGNFLDVDLFSERIHIPSGENRVVSFEISAKDNDNYMSLIPCWIKNETEEYYFLDDKSNNIQYGIRLLDRQDDDQVVSLTSGGVYCSEKKNEFPRLTNVSLGISVDASMLTESTWSGSFRLFLYQNGILVGTENLMQDVTLQRGTGYVANNSIYSLLPEGIYEGKVCYRSKNSSVWKEISDMDGMIRSYTITVLSPEIPLTADYSIVENEEYSIPSNEMQEWDNTFFPFRYCLSNLNLLDYSGELALFMNDKQVSQPVAVTIKGERVERKTGIISLDISKVSLPARLELRERQLGSLDYVKVDDVLCRNYAVIRENPTANDQVLKDEISCYYDRVRDAFVLTGLDIPDRISVFSVDGKVWYRSRVSGIQSLIPVSGWPNGIYVLLLNDKSYRIMK